MPHKYKLVDRICESCSKPFKSRRAAGRGRFHGRVCRNRGMSTERLNQILADPKKKAILINPLMGYRQISPLIGYSPVTVLKYRRKLGIITLRNNRYIKNKRILPKKPRIQLTLGFTPPPGLAEAMVDRTKAYAYIAKWRWPNGAFCPRCGDSRLYMFKTGYTCSDCHYLFSPTTKSAFHQVHRINSFLKLIYYLQTQPDSSISEIKRFVGVDRTTITMLSRRLSKNPFANDAFYTKQFRLKQSKLQKERHEKLYGPKIPKPFKPGGRLPKQQISLLNLKPYKGYK